MLLYLVKRAKFGVLPGHASLLSTLGVGVIVIEKEDTTEAIAINWGHANVDENSVDVIVDGAVSLTPGDKSSTVKT